MPNQDTYPVASVVAVAVAVDGFDSGFAAAVRQDCRIAWLPIAVAVVADEVLHSHRFLEVTRPSNRLRQVPPLLRREFKVDCNKKCMNF